MLPDYDQSFIKWLLGEMVRGWVMGTASME